MEARGEIQPGLPVANPTISYWQDPPDHIADHRTTETLPASADYVVIGSGVSGSFIAYSLLSRRPDAKVVMLEARQACSGATGRNGGHTKAATWRTFLSHVHGHGLEEAKRILELEQRTVNGMHAFAKDHNIQCDSTICETIDIIYSQEQWDFGMRTLKYMKKHLPNGPWERYEVVSKEEAEKKYFCPDSLGALRYAAGSVQSYHLGVGVLKVDLEMGLNLQTNTPATSIREGEGGKGWNVETPRGTISTPNVILATNGYTAHLLSSFQGTIVPLRGQMSAQRPGSGMPSSGLPGTYTFFYGAGYEYMVPRPPGSKDAGYILIGGGWSKLKDGGAEEFGETDDTALNTTVSAHLTQCTKSYYGKNWGADDPEGQIHREWTGIMGTSADGEPYIGQHPHHPGIYLCASFNGHGMALCQQSAFGLVTSMLGSDQEKKELDEWFPRSFWLTEERMKVPFEGRRDVKLPAKVEGEDDEAGEGVNGHVVNGNDKR